MAHETYAITGASSNQRDATRALIICAVIAGGLAFDQLVPFWGQTLTSAGVWLLLWQWVRHAPREEKITLVSCVIYATLGECFLSLAWGLYDYRLGNVPAFVPPGHALLLMLGIILARRLPGWITWAAPALAADNTSIARAVSVLGILPPDSDVERLDHSEELLVMAALAPASMSAASARVSAAIAEAETEQFVIIGDSFSGS